MNKQPQNQALATSLVDDLKDKGWLVRCVESCTAGGLTAALGWVSGASAVLDRSWVTYSNQAKHEEVGVPLDVLEKHGAVSEAVVLAMAEGAVVGCKTNTVSIAVSGVAGPTGGTAEKPVGTVWIAVKTPGQQSFARCFYFQGNRAQIQAAAIAQALAMPLQG